MADVAVSGEMDDQMSDMRSKNEEKAIVSSVDYSNLNPNIKIDYSNLISMLRKRKLSKKSLNKVQKQYIIWITRQLSFISIKLFSMTKIFLKSMLRKLKFTLSCVISVLPYNNSKRHYNCDLKTLGYSK
jgi:hypothetical protein